MKIRQRRQLLVSVAALWAAGAAAQPAGVPSADEPGITPLAEVPVERLPLLDNAALRTAADAIAPAGGPHFFAEPVGVDLAPSAAGWWDVARDGREIWRAVIESPGAESLNLGFSRYAMPAGGVLYLYPADGQGPIAGPFTEDDNEAHGELWSPILAGDSIVVEVVLPPGASVDLDLEIGSVNHGFRSLASPRSGTCNVDVVCPEGDGWRDQIRAVGVYSIGGSRTCSGALVNNTANDRTPYFLTANHCLDRASEANSIVVYWNYENSTCRPVGDSGSGGIGDGSLTQFNSGGILRATDSGPDFTLVELDDPIDDAVNAHFAGWDRSDSAPPSAVTIHHPRTFEKRISFENDPITITDYLGNTIDPAAEYLRVANWDLGTTEPGSSGSPLFNPGGRVVGFLSGGFAACGNDLPDWYGRFASAWTGGGTAATSLAPWLDPVGTGTMTIDGIDAARQPIAGDVNGDGTVTPGDAQMAFACYMNFGCEAGADEIAADLAPDNGDGCIGPEDSDGMVTPVDAQRIFRVYTFGESECPE